MNTLLTNPEERTRTLRRHQSMTRPPASIFFGRPSRLQPAPQPLAAAHRPPPPLTRPRALRHPKAAASPACHGSVHSAASYSPPGPPHHSPCPPACRSPCYLVSYATLAVPKLAAFSLMS